jgi:3-oxoadipate enol-lactonase
MERFVDVPGGRLFVADDGEGPPVVLIHCAIADLRAWDAMVPGLAARYRVVRYDYRGFGKTTTEDVEYSDRADLIAVLDALGIGRASLVGNSRGAMIAFDTAIEFPERVVAVVGVGAGLGGFWPDATAAEQELFDEGDRLMAAPEPDLDAIADFSVRLWLDGPGQPPDRVDPAVRETLRVMCRPLSEPGRVRGRAIRLDQPANDRLAELRCPVLALAGELDVSECPQTARRIEAGAPNARAVIWPDVAHVVGMEAPDRLNALLLEFLAPLGEWT